MKKKMWIFAALLLCVTAVLAAVHLTTREKVPEGSLLVEFDDKKSYVSIDRLQMTEISGTFVNKKGETQEIHRMGVSLAEVLKAAGIDGGSIRSVTATAEDEFSAELQAEEIRDGGTAFLVREEDGRLRLIVLKDRDMRRNVRNVARLTVR